ncbi:hypothetical protein TUM4438_45140 [Shewanella sairae]|uniref:Uncharacterized protein n=1 Tax=Shewanella sairae TaxID=190310 RepID=A0ABQ4PRQ1_9GAMM|nr:hypothetical protein TUM4438_46830 [Shewanella sairae]GIU52430.1 hypothetical protein TUM4438_45140 [Shewanella sairae]
MAILTYVIENPGSSNPVLHAAWCPNVGLVVSEVGLFVGCYTAMEQSKTQYPNLKACHYCCGAISC